MFSEASLLNAKSSLWPVLTASYARVRTGPSFFPENDHWTAAGVLSYPLFSAGPTSTLYAVKAAHRNIDKATANIRSTRNSVRNDLESTWATLATKIDLVDVQRQYLVAARQRNDEASIRYSSGLMTFENWEIIATDYVNFARSALRAEHDAVVAEAQWHQAMGKTLEE
jgi:outer membrane protein TolC